MPNRRPTILVLFAVAAWSALACAANDAKEVPTGPQTESRFPPLVVPEGFHATLFACDPLIEYPSTITLGPRKQTVFVAQDYLTGLGTDIIRHDEVRLVQDSDNDGYADTSTVYASDFNSIQGLAFHEGTLFVMHAPLLTALRDTDGDDIADERRDLFSGLGLAPEDNPPRLHCANGVTAGHDNWLYLSLGDHGCDVLRPEGDRLVFQGGGILRCRPDGSGLHIFATGLRNIYDVALDDELNVFVRDNENDGGTYMVRVYHSFYGADHGYPYDYYERPTIAMSPLADLARGSSAGGTCYLESAFPSEYIGSLFFCEWGRSVVNYRRHRDGSSFAPMKEFEFAAGAETDPYGFKPTDVIVDRDGSLLVSDWADGQRPKRGRGRIYRISYGDKPEPASQPSDGETTETSPTVASGDALLQGLNSQRYHERVSAQFEIQSGGRDAREPLMLAIRDKKLGTLGRLHAVWILAESKDAESRKFLFELARQDTDPRVRAQAVRALSDLYDPVLVQGKLDAGPGDAAVASRLAALAADADPRVQLEVTIALGRLQWNETPDWLRENVGEPDVATAHAAMHALRRSHSWPSVLDLLDEESESPLRAVALHAVSDQFEPTVIDGLIDRVRDASPSRQTEYAAMLCRVYNKPGPWEYWGYRPAPRPANTVAWEKTDSIAAALDWVLTNASADVRAETLATMQREQVPAKTGTLGAWLAQERNPTHVAMMLKTLSAKSSPDNVALLERVVRNPAYDSQNRIRALESMTELSDEPIASRLLAMANDLEDGPVLSKAIRLLGTQQGLSSKELLLHCTSSAVPDVRAAALESLAKLKPEGADAKVLERLDDPDADVRRAAAYATGQLGLKDAAPRLLVLARDDEYAIRAAALESLASIGDPHAVDQALAALERRETLLPALSYLRLFGGPDHADSVARVAKTDRSTEAVIGIVDALSSWRTDMPIGSPDADTLDRLIAMVQGESGLLVHWNVRGPIATIDATQLKEVVTAIGIGDEFAADPEGWQTQLAVAGDASVQLSRKDGGEQSQDAMWLAVSEIVLPEPTDVQFLASANCTFTVWLNGEQVYANLPPGLFVPDSERFSVSLPSGPNRLVVALNSTEHGPRFHLRFRQRSSSAKREELAQAALERAGNPARGRAVFYNKEKSLCLKCHRLGSDGGRIGPELTGVGSRFSRVHLIESILEPSRTVAPNYETIIVALEDGRVLTGVTTNENETVLSLGDQTGKTHELPKSIIEERTTQSQSTMPEGLEDRLSEREFVDLIAFLRSQAAER